MSEPRLAPLPSLDQLAAQPEAFDSLPSEAQAALLERAEVLAARLRIKLLAARISAESNHAAEPDRMLLVEEAARLAGVTENWLYRHADQLPFTRRLTKKALRFSAAGLQRWLASRRP